MPDLPPRQRSVRERRAIACDGCGLIEVWPDDQPVERCPSCGDEIARLRTITRRECDVCGLVEPFSEYDGRYVSSGTCAHRAWSERVYVCMAVQP